ncbi:MAG: hypothetical protein LAT67_09430 [Balneolales bacterium]|nr:hypothetical protein [Balneolales bacterium]
MVPEWSGQFWGRQERGAEIICTSKCKITLRNVIPIVLSGTTDFVTPDRRTLRSSAVSGDKNKTQVSPSRDVLDISESAEG